MREAKTKKKKEIETIHEQKLLHRFFPNFKKRASTNHKLHVELLMIIYIYRTSQNRSIKTKSA